MQVETSQSYKIDHIILIFFKIGTIKIRQPPQKIKKGGNVVINDMPWKWTLDPGVAGREGVPRLKVTRGRELWTPLWPVEGTCALVVLWLPSGRLHLTILEDST